jgi:hypothetical protein
LRSIRRNLLRSFLTILGIVIGVSAVITMVTLGNGATQAVQTQIASLGSNLLMVRVGQRQGPGGAAGAPQFKEADAAAIQSQIGGVAAAAPEGRAAVTVVGNGRNWATNVTGSSNAWFVTGNWKLASGRLFEDDEQRAGAAVCIIGETVRREIFGGALGLGGLGESLRIKQFSCTVIGVLASKGQAAMGNDQDDTVLVPLRTLQRRVTGSLKVGTLLISMEDGSDNTRLKASLRQLLRERRKLADARRRQLQHPRYPATRRHAVGNDTGDDHPARCRGRGQSAGRRHRHHEHHAGQRHRTYPRNRPAPGHRCAGARGAAAIPDRVGGPGGARRGDRHRHRHGRLLRARQGDGGYPICSIRQSTCCRSSSRPASACSSAISRPGVPRRWTRSKRCGTNRLPVPTVEHLDRGRPAVYPAVPPHGGASSGSCLDARMAQRWRWRQAAPCSPRRAASVDQAACRFTQPT